MKFVRNTGFLDVPIDSSELFILNKDEALGPVVQRSIGCYKVKWSTIKCNSNYYEYRLLHALCEELNKLINTSRTKI